MLIGKPGAARTSIAATSSDRVMVRGRDLARELMGVMTFTDYVFLLAAGRAPTEDQRFFLDLSLVALAEHGLTPSVQAARMTLDADPAALQGAIAAGVETLAWRCAITVDGINIAEPVPIVTG